jgi:hypothetical protein
MQHHTHPIPKWPVMRGDSQLGIHPIRLATYLIAPLRNLALTHRMLPSSFASHCCRGLDAPGALVWLNPMLGGVGVNEQASTCM